MSDKSQEIKIVDVDKEEIKISSNAKGWWQVPFRLSSAPDQSWQNNFHEVHQKSTEDIKRKAQVIGSSIRVEVAGEDDLQKVLDVLKSEVAKVNVLCEQEYQQKLKIRQDLADLKQRQHEAILKLKGDADKLEF